MVIAIAMRMMQASAHQVIDVIPVRHGFVTAGRAVLVRAAHLRRALHGVGGIDRDGMLVDMILVHVVQMPVVQVIDVTFVAHRRMPAIGTMLVGMIGMMLLRARRHDGGSFLPRSETDLGSMKSDLPSAQQDSVHSRASGNPGPRAGSPLSRGRTEDASRLIQSDCRVYMLKFDASTFGRERR